ncbi:DUF2255 family protein [Catellatospora tritici]|uniref:DUF2255 family protein n=1 Tax=Catellatospora tritici TaxID=2851566 RepID=UPI001C2D910E|nr:DUF2255 family protein [Catellatospora tritici]MBV1853659.1 DUF2255 family protein [Catellatospora tritici]
MAVWSAEELDVIGNAEELQISSRRRDGSLREPVTIWVVRAGDDLYIRSYRGAEGSWYRGARASRRGRIRAGGVDRDVDFDAVTDPGANDRVDAAYRGKYRGDNAQYVDPMIAPQARATTMRLLPR